MYTKKRGQITVFIIIGIVLLAFTAGTIYLVKTFTEEKLPPPEIIEVQPVKDYVENCLENQLKEVTSFVALQGGYFGMPDYPLEYSLPEADFSLSIPYYFYNFEHSLPSQAEVEREISLGLVNTLRACTDFSFFPYNISVEEDRTDVTTQINPGFVRAIVKLPIHILVGNSIKDIDVFQIKINSEFYKAYQTAVEISNQQYLSGRELCLTCLSEMAEKNNLSLALLEIEGDKSYLVIYTISDNSNKQLVFNFAHKFNLLVAESSPFVQISDSLSALAGKEFEYVVKGEGDNITFFDDSDLFDIDPQSGLIQFTPKEEDLGFYFITITIKDALGNRDEEIITFHITKDEENLPQIEDMPSFVANVSGPFSYVVKAYSPLGLEINFTEDSDLFEIDSKTGVIEFTPKETDFGVQDFTVTVTDEQGNQNTKEVSLTIQ